MNLKNDHSIWDRVARELQINGGWAIVDLVDEDLSAIPHAAFAQARILLDHMRQVQLEPELSEERIAVRTIPAGADSAHVTGYHPADSNNSLSRFNRYREGFVWSDGYEPIIEEDITQTPADTVAATVTTPATATITASFQKSTQDLHNLLHDIAQAVMGGLEREWDIPEKWFADALQARKAVSQWHLKRYVHASCHSDDSEAKIEGPPLSTTIDDWLPAHTDPSLISVVIVDRPGKQTGSQGLEYSTRLPTGERVWREIPFTGHAVAVIFIGSVLGYITGGRLPACKHRVVPTMTTGTKEQRDRMAATFFLRPTESAGLVVPPSPRFNGVSLKRRRTFQSWLQRVAKNYGLSQKTEARVEDNHSTAIPSRCRINYRDEQTDLALIGADPPLRGREKYLGGEVGQNGKIYTIPGFATQVLVIDPSVEPPTIRPIGPHFDGPYKWLRSVRMPESGIIIGLPCHADSVLRIDPRTEEVRTLHWDANDPKAPPVGLPWKWHGGCVSPHDGCLYCIPQQAEFILKYDPVTEHLSFIGDRLPGKNKFYGGLLGSDGAIYGINQCYSSVIRIDPVTQSFSLHGEFLSGSFQWHGGVKAPNGNIYGIPANADRVLKIIPGIKPQLSLIGPPLRTGAHRMDGKYKYLGGAVGRDRNVYFFPSDCDYVLQVNIETDECREVGPNLRNLERMHNNKWQNGFATEQGAIYGIPLKGQSVLRILTKDSGEDPDIAVIGGPFEGLNSWEGGVMIGNGDMFCMPLNHPDVLRIRHISL